MSFLRKPGKGYGTNIKEHYRTLNLIAHISNMFTKMVVSRKSVEIAASVSPTQFGALPGRSTRDALALLMEVLDRHRRAPRQRQRLPAAMLFDLSKAFDNVDREFLWGALEKKASSKDFRIVLEKAA